MTKFDDIYEIAADNHGLITAKQANQVNIGSNELVQYARRGRIEKVGHGLYKLKRWVPEPNDAYAWAVAVVGSDAVLFGESVIAMLELVPTNPNYFYVATPRRVRRKLPENFRVKFVDGIAPSAHYDGIPSQCAYDAIIACKASMMKDRLLLAAKNAHELGYISAKKLASLKRVLED